jgi:flagellar FliL protein
MATKPEAAADAPKPKSKKLLIIIVAVVVLALGGGGGAFFIMQKNKAKAEAEANGEEAVAEEKHADPKTLPQFLPLDNMVVNLADPGGNRFAQVGLTLQLEDQATVDKVKAFMPAIRNDVLRLLSKRTSDEMLAIEGKDKLTEDILLTVRTQLGVEEKKKKNPVQAVLFSSFIVQ